MVCPTVELVESQATTRGPGRFQKNPRRSMTALAFTLGRYPLTPASPSRPLTASTARRQHHGCTLTRTAWRAPWHRREPVRRIRTAATRLPSTCSECHARPPFSERSHCSPEVVSTSPVSFGNCLAACSAINRRTASAFSASVNGSEAIIASEAENESALIGSEQFEAVGILKCRVPRLCLTVASRPTCRQPSVRQPLRRSEFGFSSPTVGSSCSEMRAFWFCLSQRFHSDQCHDPLAYE